VTLIKEGRTTKEIADHVGVSKEAVDMQRFLCPFLLALPGMNILIILNKVQFIF
jgi:hypothetical protein